MSQRSDLLPLREFKKRSSNITSGTQSKKFQTSILMIRQHIPHFRLRVPTTSFLRKHQTPQLLTQRPIPHTCHSKLPAMEFKFPGVLMTGTRKLTVHVWEPIMKDINTVKRMALLGWMAGGTNSAYRKAFRWERAQALLERRVARSKLELQLQLPAQSINHNLI